MFGLLGSDLKFSTTNYPTDKQRVRINGMLEEYLRHFVSASQKNWIDLLDVAQFCYILYKSSSTEHSLYELVYGYQPIASHEITKQWGGRKYPAAYRLALDWQEMLKKAKDSLVRETRRMKKYAD